MPTFTISKDGRTLNTLTLEDERIELGSANTCKLFIDDLLISLHQAAFLRTRTGYDIEPIARTPSFTINGEKVTERTPLAPDAVIAIEGYEIRAGLDAGAAAAENLAPLPEPLDLSPELPPLPPIDLPPAKPAAPPKPPSPLPPLPPIDAPAPQPPREKSLPPIPPPLPPIPEPLFAEDAPPKAPPSRALSAVPPPLPPLPPLEPPHKAKLAADAPTQYVVPIKPIGKLVVTAGPLKGRSWPLAGSELKIGREQGRNDILVRFDAKGEVDTSVSRRHASIHIEGDYAFVEDQGSAAGTFVNGRQANKGERVPLRSGDEIEIRSAKESTVFRVELGDSSSHAAIPPPLPEPGYSPPPPIPEPAPRRASPEPRSDSRPQEREEPREREPIRRQERRARLDDDNPFAPTQAQGMPQWVWFAIGGAVVVIILILVFVFM